VCDFGLKILIQSVGHIIFRFAEAKFSLYLIKCVLTYFWPQGGIKAVIWTDTFQVLMMFGGMVAVVAKGTVDAGGFANTWQKAEESNRIEFFK